VLDCCMSHMTQPLTATTRVYLPSPLPSVPPTQNALHLQHNRHLHRRRNLLTLLPSRLRRIKDILLDPAILRDSSVRMRLIDIIWRRRWLRPSLIHLWICRVGGCARCLIGGLSDFPDASAATGVCRMNRLDVYVLDISGSVHIASLPEHLIEGPPFGASDFPT
jgi:hypothetical protein